MCDKVILICGCFDLFHVGHLHLLKQASKFGKLWVAIGDDESIRDLKGEGRPVIPAEERQEMIHSQSEVYTTHVFHFKENPMDAHRELLRWSKPDMYAEGPDHNNVAMYPLLEEACIPRLIIPNKIQGTRIIVDKMSAIPYVETPEEAQEFGDWEPIKTS